MFCISRFHYPITANKTNAKNTPKIIVPIPVPPLFLLYKEIHLLSSQVYDNLTSHIFIIQHNDCEVK